MTKRIEWTPINQDEEKIMTPAGLVASSEVYGFDFWRCDTNFPIERDHKKQIDVILGVETLNILTPYRFIISVAKMFDPDKVKHEIKDLLIGKEITEIDILVEQLMIYKDWIILLLPNGEYTYTHDQDELFLEKMQILEETKKNVGGQIFRPNGV